MSAQRDQHGKVTTRTLRAMKAEGEKIASMTAYDAAFAAVGLAGGYLAL